MNWFGKLLRGIGWLVIALALVGSGVMLNEYNRYHYQHDQKLQTAVVSAQVKLALANAGLDQLTAAVTKQFNLKVVLENDGPAGKQRIYCVMPVKPYEFTAGADDPLVIVALNIIRARSMNQGCHISWRNCEVVKTTPNRQWLQVIYPAKEPQTATLATAAKTP